MSEVLNTRQGTPGGEHRALCILGSETFFYGTEQMTVKRFCGSQHMPVERFCGNEQVVMKHFVVMG